MKVTRVGRESFGATLDDLTHSFEKPYLKETFAHLAIL
jgi:hypothetical protein